MRIRVLFLKRRTLGDLSKVDKKVIEFLRNYYVFLGYLSKVGGVSYGRIGCFLW